LGTQAKELPLLIIPIYSPKPKSKINGNTIGYKKHTYLEKLFIDFPFSPYL